MKDFSKWAHEISSSIFAVDDDVLNRAAEICRDSSIVLTAGNGGSSALASHAAQALMKPAYASGGGVAAACLTDMVPTLTAHANDGGWDDALIECSEKFRILSIHDVPKPALLVFSSSGKSKNVVGLAKYWRESRLEVIAFTGFNGEPLRSLATLSIHVDSDDYEVVEPVHQALLHRVQAHFRPRHMK